MKDIPEVLTAEEVADLLRLPRYEVLRISRGPHPVLKRIKYPGLPLRVAFARSEVERYLRAMGVPV